MTAILGLQRLTACSFCMLMPPVAVGDMTPRHLQLMDTLPLHSNQSQALQPSGLAFCDQRLLMISDRHDRQIFQLHIEPGQAKVTSYRAFNAPEHPQQSLIDDIRQLISNKRYDWEGISCQGDSLYLLSEQYHAVLANDSNGSYWLNLPYQQFVATRGILTQHNAGFEGISWNDNHQLLLAAERDARGLLQFTSTTPTLQSPATPWRLTQLATPLPPTGIADPDRNPDFSGLVFDPPWIYSLERNLFQICQRDSEFEQVKCWSYRDVELADSQRYDSYYGVAEGIAVDQQWIYLVTDNNDKPLLTDPGDRRPRLWIFAKPDDWHTVERYSKP